MTEAEWLAERSQAQGMLRYVLAPGMVQRTKTGKRKLRLFACGCCRLIWSQLNDVRLHRVVEVAERFADSEASKKELQSGFEGFIELTLGGYLLDAPGVHERTAARMVHFCMDGKAWCAALGMTGMPLPLAGYFADGEIVLCDLLRCIFGNSFRPITLEPSWRTEAVTALAAGIYTDRAFDRLPILADALQEAGCEDVAVLAHCRDGGPHARGCWVVDQLLGKE